MSLTSPINIIIVIIFAAIFCSERICSSIKAINSQIAYRADGMSAFFQRIEQLTDRLSCIEDEMQSCTRALDDIRQDVKRMVERCESLELKADDLGRVLDNVDRAIGLAAPSPGSIDNMAHDIECLAQHFADRSLTHE